MIEKDIVETITFIILGFMGFLALWATIERVLFFAKVDLYNYTKKELLETDLTRNFTLIATIANNAPYVGLLGTVFGIMISFYNIGLVGQIDASAVMTGLALALKATALGLLVAIPATVSYNLLARKAEVLISRWEADENQKD